MQQNSSIQSLDKAAGFAIHPCDGFVTAFLMTSDEVAYQFSFWLHDLTPDAEDTSKEIGTTERFNIPSKRVVRTAVRMNPDIAWQLAQNILQNLQNLPDNMKQRYRIPQILYPAKK
jgi:hypothetical protein